MTRNDAEIDHLVEKKFSRMTVVGFHRIGSPPTEPFESLEMKLPLFQHLERMLSIMEPTHLVS